MAFDGIRTEESRDRQACRFDCICVQGVLINGLFGLIGVKNGDVLQRLNDFPLDSPDKALQSFIALKGQSRLKLDLIRDGQPATFNYDIR